MSPDQRRLIYLVTTTEAVFGAGLACVVTDGNAAAALTSFSDDPAALETLIDWSVMGVKQWTSTAEDPDRLRRRMAEFLVYEAVPLSLISEIGAIDSAARGYMNRRGTRPATACP